MTVRRLTRRRVLAAGALAGAMSGVRLRAAGGEPGAMPAAGPGLIDVHHHVLPPDAPAAMRRLMAGWSVAGAVAGMDAAGIATGIAWPGPIRGLETAKGRMVARQWNEFGAGLGRDRPGRFGLFASLPFEDTRGTLDEIDHALDHLAADGFGIATSYGALWLGDRTFWPIYDKLNARDAVVFVHPFDAPCCAPASMTYARPPIDGSWIEWPMDTARTILSLAASGTLRRYPRIRFIFCHGGGVMPLLIERIAGFRNWQHVGADGLAETFPDGIEHEFRQLHFECAQACSVTNMNALRSLVPDSQILFGTDFPFFSLSYGAAQFRNLRLPAATQAAIGHRNAARLLPRRT